jgi:hypothetical protein
MKLTLNARLSILSFILCCKERAHKSADVDLLINYITQLCFRTQSMTRRATSAEMWEAL